jgi:hypothetical protein
MIEQYLIPSASTNSGSKWLMCDPRALRVRDEPLMIEINPYGLSDPCLLTYEELETSTGMFRIVEAEAAAA